MNAGYSRYLLLTVIAREGPNKLSSISSHNADSFSLPLQPTDSP